MRCSICKGTGKIQLFTSEESCECVKNKTLAEQAEEVFGIKLYPVQKEIINEFGNPPMKEAYKTYLTSAEMSERMRIAFFLGIVPGLEHEKETE